MYITVKSNKEMTATDKVLDARLIQESRYKLVLQYGTDTYSDFNRYKVTIEITMDGKFRLKEIKNNMDITSFWTFTSYRNLVVANKELMAAIALKLGTTNLLVGDDNYTFGASHFRQVEVAPVVVIEKPVVKYAPKSETVALAELLVAGINLTAALQKKKFY